MLTLDDISCVRQENPLFSRLGFTIGDACLLYITGQNGSGKSSLLRIMAGLLKPSEGRILYANEPVDGEHASEYAQIIHYVGHKPALHLDMTVHENLAFLSDLQGNRSRLAAAMHFFELEDRAHLPLWQLSMGWQKRVILARLLIREAEIWLLDEPHTHLDEQGRFLLDGLIRARIDQGGSVVIASNEHNFLPGYRELSLQEFRLS